MRTHTKFGLIAAALLGLALAASAKESRPATLDSARLVDDDGVLRVKSAYGLSDTVQRLRASISSKGLHFFDEIDQGKLARDAGVPINPSVLLEFGNPGLGTQFLSANPYAGLDWPVRMLVVQDQTGQVWIAYSDFAWIAHRHHIKSRDAQLAMATEYAASIASAAQAK